MSEVENEVTPREKASDYHEIGRVFPFSEADFDLDRLSPHPFEITNEDGESEWVKASHPAIRDKVELPKPLVILQDQNGEDKQIKNVELTDEEWDRLKKAYEAGKLDPDGNGTNRLVSQASLTNLGLERIEKLLGPGRHSGSYEGVV